MNKIQIIVGSTRPNRFGIKVAEWVHEQAKNNNDIDVEIVDLADWDLPLLNEPKSAVTKSYKNEHTKKWVSKLSEADGFIWVTPEYNHGYPASLKNAIDYSYWEWYRKPVAIVSYGGSGKGIRSAEQLKLVALEFEMMPIWRGLNFTKGKDVDEDGVPTSDKAEEAAQKLLNDLNQWADTLKPMQPRNQ